MSQYRAYFSLRDVDPEGMDVSKRKCKAWKQSSCCLEYCGAEPANLVTKVGQKYQPSECQKCCYGTCSEKSCDEICEFYMGLTKLDDPFHDVDGIGGVLTYDGKLCPCLFSYPDVMGIKPGDCPDLDKIVIDHENNHIKLDLELAKSCRIFRRKGWDSV